MRAGRVCWLVAVLGILAGSAHSAAPLPVSTEPTAIVQTLTEQFGCDDTVVAREPGGTAALGIVVPGILERARDADLPYREEIELGSSDILVRLELGAHLDHWCTDVMARPPRIDEVWAGVSGTATVILVERELREPVAGSSNRPIPTAAVVHLNGAVLKRDGHPPTTTTLPDLEIAGKMGVPAGG